MMHAVQPFEAKVLADVQLGSVARMGSTDSFGIGRSRGTRATSLMVQDLP